ncbi:GGDEF domain-containing protein [Gammaproteobacteria bacterium LSUCC0112]|nr:GGDEF domain-containing protein [Gammaproteobacteria bacterium LSUCC0112]
MLFLDLDEFKLINDTLGHEAGDDLLIEVARRVKNTLRESDVVARLGGDEFVALLRRSGNPEEINEIAVKVLHAVCQPYKLQSQDTVITASIGISVYPQDGLDEQTLIRHADTAMYHAKQNGRNQVRLFAQLPPESNS